MHTTCLNGESHQIAQVYIEWTDTLHYSPHHTIRFIQRKGQSKEYIYCCPTFLKQANQEEAQSINRLYGEKSSDSPSIYRIQSHTTLRSLSYYQIPPQRKGQDQEYKLYCPNTNLQTLLFLLL